MQTRKIQELVLERPVSRFYVEDIAHFKSHVVKVNAARIEKSALQPFIEVSSKELTDYLKDEKNSGILKMMYDGRKAEFEKPEEVKAYHILFKGSDEKTKARIELLAKTLNTKNFKTIASKQTEDPSGKNKDGALGWFAPGKMVPEFDKVAFSLKPGSISKPFKTSFGYHIVYVEDKKTAQKTSFDKAKVQLAEEAIRRKKSAALDELMKKVSTEIKTAFEKSNINMAKQIADKYKLNFFKDDEINAFDAKLGNHSINDQRLKTLFSSKNKVIEFTDSSFAWVFDVKNTVQKAKDDKLAKSELNGQANQISRLFRNEFIKNITQTASIDCMADFQKVSYCNN